MDLLYALLALAMAVLPIGLFWALLAWGERKHPHVDHHRRAERPRIDR